MKKIIVLLTLYILLASCDIDKTEEQNGYVGTWIISQQVVYDIGNGELATFDSKTILITNNNNYRIMNDNGKDSKGTLLTSGEYSITANTTHMWETSINEDLPWIEGEKDAFNQAGHLFENTVMNWSKSQGNLVLEINKEALVFTPYILTAEDYIGNWRSNISYYKNDDVGGVQELIRCELTSNTYVYESYCSDGTYFADKGTIEVLSNYTVKWTQTHIKNSNGDYGEVLVDPWSNTYYGIPVGNRINFRGVKNAEHSMSFYKEEDSLEEWPPVFAP